MNNHYVTLDLPGINSARSAPFERVPVRVIVRVGNGNYS